MEVVWRHFSLLPLSSLLFFREGGVTNVCLGTMTWGVQNTEEEAFEQLDYAIKVRGVNFIDTAELYPVPSSSSLWVAGNTEKIIGKWIERNKELRKELIVATKVAGFIEASDIPKMRTEPPGEEKMSTRLDRREHFERVRCFFTKVENGLHRRLPVTLAG